MFLVKMRAAKFNVLKPTLKPRHTRVPKEIVSWKSVAKLNRSFVFSKLQTENIDTTLNQVEMI